MLDSIEINDRDIADAVRRAKRGLEKQIADKRARRDTGTISGQRLKRERQQREKKYRYRCALRSDAAVMARSENEAKQFFRNLMGLRKFPIDAQVEKF